MNHEEMRRSIAGAIGQVSDILPGDGDDPKKAAPKLNDAELRVLVVFGLTLVGELLLDIKRIADAAERPPGEEN